MIIDTASKWVLVQATNITLEEQCYMSYQLFDNHNKILFKAWIF